MSRRFLLPIIATVAVIGACTQRRIPEIEQAAKFCGVSYLAMRDAYWNSLGPNGGVATRVTVLGRCEITHDGINGGVTTRILDRPAH